MAAAKLIPNISWDSLKLSAEPLRGRSDILVVAHVEIHNDNHGRYDQYRVNFEINRQNGIVAYEADVLDFGNGAGEPVWKFSTRRDVIVAIRDHFLTSSLYAHLAQQLGWVSTQADSSDGRFPSGHPMA